MPSLRLPKYAKAIGIHPKTAYEWYRAGILPHPVREITSRTFLVDVPEEEHLPKMKLSDWARSIGVNPKTAYKWYRAGTLPHPAKQITSHIILVDVPAKDSHLKGVGLYARVSSSDQQEDLLRQIERLRTWADMQGCHVVREEAEIAPGTHGNRRKVLRLLADPQVWTIVVEHEDRLGRTNLELVEAALSFSNRHLVVLDPEEERKDDLPIDMARVLTSFCGKMYGYGTARKRAQRALECAAQPPE